MQKFDLNQDLQASMEEARPITNSHLHRKNPLNNVHAASAENISSSDILEVPTEIFTKSRMQTNNKRSTFYPRYNH